MYSALPLVPNYEYLANHYAYIIFLLDYTVLRIGILHYLEDNPKIPTQRKNTIASKV